MMENKIETQEQVWSDYHRTWLYKKDSVWDETKNSYIISNTFNPFTKAKEPLIDGKPIQWKFRKSTQ